uniref:Small integral membrane protein 22 n=1 Tax=Labrus bergylta TaxID=56723 RepID=A0A3Q3ES06_9LABR
MIEDQFQDVVSRLQSKEFFQSDWDIASFAVFFIFIGMVLLLVILVLIRCCCCCCCDNEKVVLTQSNIFSSKDSCFRGITILREISTDNHLTCMIN